MIKNGFTLIELVITLLIFSIVAIVGSKVIFVGFKSYSNTLNRQEQPVESIFLIEKITREINNAVPNSLKIEKNGECISFISTLSYLVYLDFPLVNEKEIKTFLLFDVDHSNNKKYLIINPSLQEDFLNKENNRFVSIVSLDKIDNITHIRYQSTNNPAFISSTEAKRAFTYEDKLINYCVLGNEVNRIETDFLGNELTKNIVAKQVVDLNFDMINIGYNYNNMVRVLIKFTNDYGEITSYERDIQVLNVP